MTENAKSELIGKKCVIFRKDGTCEIGVYKAVDDLNYYFFDEQKGVPFEVPRIDVIKVTLYTGGGK